MHSPRRLACVLLSAGIAASGLVAGGAAAASAESTSDTVALASAAASHGASVSPNATITCKVQIQNPHNSSHVRGTVNVVTTVKCTARVADIKLNVQLYHNGRQVAARGFNRAGVSSLQGNAAHACASGSYQGRAQVTVAFPPGYKPPVERASVASRTVNIHC
jgi:hypothetical protein